MPERWRRARTVLRPYYLMRPHLWAEPRLRIIDERSMVSRRRGFVYMRIPKAANSTVMRALLARYPDEGASAGDIDAAKTAAVHFRNLGFRDLWWLRDAFVFTVVRDPYARALSAYRDKFRSGDKHRTAFGPRVAAHDDGALSFRGFCRYLAADGEAENAHWMRQTRLLRLTDRLDYVGRVETLATDLPTILARIGGAETAEPNVDAQQPASTQLADHYDGECAALVARVYRQDFERFGYALDFPGMHGR